MKELIDESKIRPAKKEKQTMDVEDKRQVCPACRKATVPDENGRCTNNGCGKKLSAPVDIVGSPDNLHRLYQNLKREEGFK